MKPSFSKSQILLVMTLFIIVVMALFPFPRDIYSHALRASMNAGHFFGFGILAWFIFKVLCRIGRGKYAYFVAAAATLVLVLLIEFIQPWFGRTASWHDVYLSLLGIATLLCIDYIWQAKNQFHWIKRISSLLGLTIALTVLYPAMIAWYGVIWHWQQFPQLGDFENKSELQFWRPNEVGKNASRIRISNDYAKLGEYSLQINAGKTRWSGVSYYAENANWSEFEFLSLHIYNPEKTFYLVVRIDDNADTTYLHDRFNRSYKILPGWQHIRIPLSEIQHSPRNRKMNMHAIRQMILFISSSQPTRTFYLDNVHLH